MPLGTGQRANAFLIQNEITAAMPCLQFLHDYHHPLAWPSMPEVWTPSPYDSDWKLQKWAQYHISRNITSVATSPGCLKYHVCLGQWQHGSINGLLALWKCCLPCTSRQYEKSWEIQRGEDKERSFSRLNCPFSLFCIPYQIMQQKSQHIQFWGSREPADCECCGIHWGPLLPA